MTLTAGRATETDQHPQLPLDVQDAVRRQVTDRPVLDVENADGGMQTRYIVVEKAPPPRKGLLSSFWGKVTATVGAIAVAGSILAASIFGLGGPGGPVAPVDQTPVAPIERVIPNDQSLPPAGTGNAQVDGSSSITPADQSLPTRGSP